MRRVLLALAFFAVITPARAATCYQSPSPSLGITHYRIIHHQRCWYPVERRAVSSTPTWVEWGRREARPGAVHPQRRRAVSAAFVRATRDASTQARHKSRLSVDPGPPNPGRQPATLSFDDRFPAPAEQFRLLELAAADDPLPTPPPATSTVVIPPHHFTCSTHYRPVITVDPVTNDFRYACARDIREPNR